MKRTSFKKIIALNVINVVLVTHHIDAKEIDHDKDKNKIIYAIEGVPNSYDPIGALLSPNPNFYSPPIGAIGVTPKERRLNVSPVGALIRPQSTKDVIDQEMEKKEDK